MMETRLLSQAAPKPSRCPVADQPIELYVQSSREVEEALARNGVSLADLLRREGVQVEERPGTLPVTTADSASREPITLLILTGVAAISALGPILTRALGIISDKPVEVVEKITEPMLDDAGKPVLDAHGRQLYKVTERHAPLKLETNVKLLGLSFTSKEN
jgi:hypothetical protein